jgi:hypothetical protein
MLSAIRSKTTCIPHPTPIFNEPALPAVRVPPQPVAPRGDELPGNDRNPQHPIYDLEFSGGHRAEEIPVPIPNTAVKLCIADDTAWATAWESRTPPGIF